LKTKLCPPHISSSSLLHVTYATLSQNRLLDAVDHLHWSLSSKAPTTSSLQSQDHKPLFLTFCILLVEQASFYFFCSLSLISLVHHHHPDLLSRQAVILDRLLKFLMTISSLILKPSFSRSLSFHSTHLLLGFISWNLTTPCLAVITDGSFVSAADKVSPVGFWGTL